MTTGTQKPFTALVLAGTRPKGDPLAKATGVAHKALVPLVGRPMLAHVVATLLRSRSVNRVIVCGLTAAEIDSGELGRLLRTGELTVAEARATPSASVNYVLQTTSNILPLLITTADHPLLTSEIVDEFCRRAMENNHDAAFALVPADLVRRAFPDSSRTYLRFRERAYSGCNLFTILTTAGLAAPRWWKHIEEHRKRPWRIMSMLGIGVLLRFVFGQMSLTQLAQYASRKMGMNATVIVMSQPEAGYDVDTVDHLKVAEAVLRSQSLNEPMGTLPQSSPSRAG